MYLASKKEKKGQIKFMRKGIASVYLILSGFVLDGLLTCIVAF